jgi:hypothetical protein
MADPQETLAHALVDALAEVGVAARATGRGVHWHVDAGAADARSMRVHCFWYGRELAGLFLGMNPAHARARPRPAGAPYEGPEYAVTLTEGGRLAEGRTHAIEEVVACARAWLDGMDLEQLQREVPFVERRGRPMRALGAQLDPRLPWAVGGDSSWELRVRGEGRRCAARADDDGAVSCAFFLGPAQIACGATGDDTKRAIEAWLVEQVDLRTLAQRVPSVVLEAHAEVLESDPARWHWLHVRDRIADPNDVLAPMRELIAALAESPMATRFYCYSSLNRLCFSASSHYPWVDEGLPVVTPVNGAYDVSGVRCGKDEAVRRVEAMLKASGLVPFFGSGA